MKRPLVSVILPAYNGELYVGQAIDSVLQQTYQNFEIIVIDDGSTDNTSRVIQNFGKKVRYVYQQNGGIGAVRNRGIAMANGDFFAFLDHDDLWLPKKLELQMEQMEIHPELDMVFCAVTQFLSPEKEEELSKQFACPKTPFKGYAIGAMLIKRDSFHKVGPFSTNFRVGEFIDWYARAQHEGLQIQYLDIPLYRRRIHGVNTIIGQRKYFSDYAKILKATIDRNKIAKDHSTKS